MLTKSKIQTQKFAVGLAKKILRANRPERPVVSEAEPSRRATIIALHGNLGAGKTTFTQGFIKALGVKHKITSPTFIIFRRHPLKSQKLIVKGQMFRNVYHFDLYRIKNLKEVLALGFKKIIRNPENIVLIEWPENAGKLIPKNSIKINFSHGKNSKERNIELLYK